MAQTEQRYALTALRIGWSTRMSQVVPLGLITVVESGMRKYRAAFFQILP